MHAERNARGPEREIAAEGRTLAAAEPTEVVAAGSQNFPAEGDSSAGIAPERHRDPALAGNREPVQEGQAAVDIDEKRAIGAEKSGGPERDHTEEVQFAAIDPELPEIGLFEEASADVDFEQPEVEAGSEPHIEGCVGLDHRAAVHGDIDRAGVDENRAVDSGDVADTAARPAGKNKVRLAVFAVKNPSLSGHS